MTAIASARYTSKIIKASALLSDTKTLLVEWNDTESVAENLDRFRRENLFGKASRSRVEDVLAIFRQRYLGDPDILKALTTLARGSMPAQSLDRILYVLTLRSDALLHDAVTGVLVPAYERGQQELNVAEVQRWVRTQVAEGRTERVWGEETIIRATRNIMATLRDFGVLHGLVRKQITPPLLPVDAFSFIALLRFRELQAGERLLRDPEWQIFFLQPLAVERLLVAAHQEHLLEFYAAGRVVRIEFPTLSLEEYARDLAQRTY